ncbi:DsbA family protein [Xylophilus sp. GW821-FHT01B05]
MTTLHYLFDPFCGWCYAAAPLVRAARALPGLTLALHGGGMMAGGNAQRVTPQLRDYVIPHDRRIATMSGQPFGDAYFDGLLRDSTAVFDSEPPTTAILAADALAGRGADMLQRQQQAHYVEGRRIADPAVLRALATDIGLDATAFEQAFAQASGTPTLQHISASRALLKQLGAQGFPSFALEAEDGSLELLDAGRYLGRAEDWQQLLTARLPAAATTDASLPLCGPDGCAI